MNALHTTARDASGVSKADAHELDAADLYHRLGGLDTFKQLSTAFYTRVFADDARWFRDIFANISKDDAIRNQYEYLSERMGGPDLYSRRKGRHMLIGRHGPYPVTERSAARWLHHMEGAISSVPEIDFESRRIMMNFFRHYAYYIVAGRELINVERLVGYGGAHYGGA